MVSPDVQQFIDLNLVDKNQQEVFQIIMDKMTRTLVGWEPREGNTEVVLAEGIAVGISEAVFAINRLPDGIMEVLLSFSVSNDAGAQPEVELRFDLSDTFGCIIPAGTSVVMTIPNNLGDIAFHTIEDLVVEEGEDYGITLALADDFTDAANNVAIGTIVEIIDSLVQVDYVRTSSLVTGGRNSEEDEDYFSRATTRMQRLTSALVLPSHFTAAALENVTVERCLAIDNYNAENDPDFNGPVGNDPGYLTLAVYGANQFVATDDKQALQHDLQEQALANLIIGVPIDPQISFFDVICSVQVSSAADPAVVISEVTDMLRDIYAPMNWPWDTKIRRNELIANISNVDDVDYVVSLTQPSADIVLTGVANLVQISTINVAVEPNV